MAWVNSIIWNGSNYRVVTVNEQGEKENLPVSALHDLELPHRSTRRIRVTTDFQTWKLVGTGSYLAGIDFPRKTESGQEVYEFEASGKIFQVPAAVLMKGMFRPLRGLAPQLFRPHGLENMAVATQSSEGAPINFFCEPQKDIGLNLSRASEGIQEALSWMYSFPSARHMWDSVLDKARAGKLGVILPEGKANLVLQATLHEDIWLVTSLTVITVKTSESPFDFATGYPHLIGFHQGANVVVPVGKQRPKQLPTLPSRDGTWQISDEEWPTIEPIAVKGRSVRHSVREIMNCILDKFGRGIAWKNVDYGRVNRPVVVSSYQQMLKDGRWDALVSVLQQLRAPVLDSCLDGDIS